MWAATERRRLSGELAAWQVAQLVARMPFAAEALDADAINPYREEPPKTEAMRRAEEFLAQMQWRVMFGPKPKGD